MVYTYLHQCLIRIPVVQHICLSIIKTLNREYSESKTTSRLPSQLGAGSISAWSISDDVNEMPMFLDHQVDLNSRKP